MLFFFGGWLFVCFDFGAKKKQEKKKHKQTANFKSVSVHQQSIEN